MKNKIRKIVVKNNCYAWNIKSINANFIGLRIWLENDRSKPWIQLKYKYNDPWLHYGEILAAGNKAPDIFALKPIRPELVAAVIESVIAKYGIAQPNFKTLNIQFDESNEIVAIKDALF